LIGEAASRSTPAGLQHQHTGEEASRTYAMTGDAFGSDPACVFQPTDRPQGIGVTGFMVAGRYT